MLLHTIDLIINRTMTKDEAISFIEKNKKNFSKIEELNCINIERYYPNKNNNVLLSSIDSINTNTKQKRVYSEDIFKMALNDEIELIELNFENRGC